MKGRKKSKYKNGNDLFLLQKEDKSDGDYYAYGLKPHSFNDMNLLTEDWQASIYLNLYPKYKLEEAIRLLSSTSVDFNKLNANDKRMRLLLLYYLSCMTASNEHNTEFRPLLSEYLGQNLVISAQVVDIITSESGVEKVLLSNVLLFANYFYKPKTEKDYFVYSKLKKHLKVANHLWMPVHKLRSFEDGMVLGIGSHVLLACEVSSYEGRLHTNKKRYITQKIGIDKPIVLSSGMAMNTDVFIPYTEMDVETYNFCQKLLSLTYNKSRNKFKRNKHSESLPVLDLGDEPSITHHLGNVIRNFDVDYKTREQFLTRRFGKHIKPKVILSEQDEKILNILLN